MRSILRRACGSAAVAASLTLVATAGTANATAVPHHRTPKVYGTKFQADPRHDFTRGIHSRHDGILRGWVVGYREGVAEYEPIKWVKGEKGRDGAFVGPPEGDVRAYASRVSSEAVLYSVSNCGSAGRPTVGRRGLGTKRCGEKALLAHLRTGYLPAMITVYEGRIVKIQEIGAP